MNLIFFNLFFILLHLSSRVIAFFSSSYSFFLLYISSITSIVAFGSISKAIESILYRA